MSTPEVAYLILVLAAGTVFAVTLAGIAWWTDKGR